MALRIPILPTDRSDGEGKTRNSTPGQVQRTDIINKEDAYFHTNMEMTVCIHGVWDAKNGDNTAATFIVFSCDITSLHEFRVQKMKLEINFANVADPTGQRPLSNPNIASRGPKTIQRYDKILSTKKKEKGIAGELGADVLIKPGIKLHLISGEEYELPYFAEVKSGWRHASSVDHRYTRVWWIFTENRKSRAGVSPNFRIAVLLKRQNDSPFQGNVAVTEFDAGWRHKGAQAWHDFFSERDPEAEEDKIVDVINFDPTAPALRPSWLTGVEASQLCDLETETGIDKRYARVWGVDGGA